MTGLTGTEVSGDCSASDVAVQSIGVELDSSSTDPNFDCLAIDVETDSLVTD